MKRVKMPVGLRFRQRLLVLALLFLVLPVFIDFGWQGWLARTPQPLPDKSVMGIGDSKSYGFPQGSYYEMSIPFTAPTDKKLLAYYRLWIPDQISSLRGLIVKQHGCGEQAAATGLDHANDLQWQALASKHQFALLGTKLPTPDIYPMCTDEAVRDRVTEHAFLRAVTALAEMSRHPELDKVPWALWGHSGGADWAMQMLHYYPERVIAVINMRCGGILFSSDKSEILDLDPASVPAMLAVPVLWTAGDRDPYANECFALPKKIFSKFRKAGAIWAMAVEANTGHESGDTRLLAIPYLDAVLTARLMGSKSLRSIPETQGWLGNIATHEIASAAQYQGNPLEAAWFPNEETARKWQQYIVMNPVNRLRCSLCRVAEKFFIFKALRYPAEDCYPDKILPTRKPAAPTNVRVTRLGEAEVALSWSFSPDLENGLPPFRIYRDNSVIKTFQGQGHNFGDAPKFPRIVLRFHDTGAGIKKNSAYAVSAYNILGESISQPVQ